MASDLFKFRGKEYMFPHCKVKPDEQIIECHTEVVKDGKHFKIEPDKPFVVQMEPDGLGKILDTGNLDTETIKALKKFIEDNYL